MSADRDPVPLGDALAVVRAELGLPNDDVLTTLESRWPDIVGTDVAVHAQLVGLRDGVVTVAVDSPPWATQLTYLEAVLVERAAAITGPGSVRAIAVRVRPTAEPNRRGNSAAKRTESGGRSGRLGNT
jgi:predicted nucleic acid-binding Zn ribbon protein